MIRRGSITLNGSAAISVKTYSSGGRTHSQDGTEQSENTKPENTNSNSQRTMRERLRVSEGLDVKLSIEEKDGTSPSKPLVKVRSANHSPLSSLPRPSSSASNSPRSSLPRISLETATRPTTATVEDSQSSQQHDSEQYQSEQMMRRREKELAEEKENERQSNHQQPSKTADRDSPLKEQHVGLHSSDPTSSTFVSPLVANKEALLLDTHNRSNSSGHQHQHAHRAKRSDNNAASHSLKRSDEGSKRKEGARTDKEPQAKESATKSSKHHHTHRHKSKAHLESGPSPTQALDGAGTAALSSPRERNDARGTHSPHARDHTASHKSSTREHLASSPAHPHSSPQLHANSGGTSAVLLATTTSPVQQQHSSPAIIQRNPATLRDALDEDLDQDVYEDYYDEDFEFEDEAEHARLAREAAMLNPFHLVVERAPLNCEKLGDNTTDSSLRQLTGEALTWKKNLVQVLPFTDNVDEFFRVGDYICSRNQRQLIGINLKNLKYFGPVPMAPDEQFVIYYDNVYILKDRMLFLAESRLVAKEKSNKSSGSSSYSSSGSSHASSIHSHAGHLASPHTTSNLSTSQSRADRDHSREVSSRRCIYSFPEFVQPFHFAASNRGITVTFPGKNYLFSTDTPSVIITSSYYFQEGMCNINFNDYGIFSFSNGDKFFFYKLGCSAPSLLVFGETSNETITCIVPPTKKEGKALVATKNFTILVSMVPYGLETHNTSGQSGHTTDSQKSHASNSRSSHARDQLEQQVTDPRDAHILSVLPLEAEKNVLFYGEDRLLVFRPDKIMDVLLSSGETLYEYFFRAEKVEIDHRAIIENFLIVLVNNVLYGWDLMNLTVRETNYPVLIEKLKFQKTNIFPDLSLIFHNNLVLLEVKSRKSYIYRKALTQKYIRKHTSSSSRVVSKKHHPTKSSEHISRVLGGFGSLNSGSASSGQGLGYSNAAINAGFGASSVIGGDAGARDGIGGERASRERERPSLLHSNSFSHVSDYIGDSVFLKRHSPLVECARQVLESPEFESLMHVSNAFVITERRESQQRVIYANEAALNLFEYTMEELYGLSLWSLRGPLSLKKDSLRAAIWTKFDIPHTMDTILYNRITQAPINLIMNSVPVFRYGKMIGMIFQFHPLLDTNSVCPLARMTSNAVTIWISQDPTLSKYAHIFCTNDITGQRLIKSKLSRLTRYGFPKNLMEYLWQKIAGRLEDEKKSQLLQLDYCSNNLLDIYESSNSLLYHDNYFRNYYVFSDIQVRCLSSALPLVSLGPSDVSYAKYLEYTFSERTTCGCDLTMLPSPHSSNGSNTGNANASGGSNSSASHGRGGGRPKSSGFNHRSGEGRETQVQVAQVKTNTTGPCQRFNTRDCHCQTNQTAGSNPNSNNSSPRENNTNAPSQSAKPSSRSNSRKNSGNGNTNNNESPRKSHNHQINASLSALGGNLITLSDSTKGSRSRKNSANDQVNAAQGSPRKDAQSSMKRKNSHNNVNNESSPRRRGEISTSAANVNLNPSGGALAPNGEISLRTGYPRKNSVNANNEPSPRKVVNINIPIPNSALTASPSGAGQLQINTSLGLLSNSGSPSSPPSNPFLSVSPAVPLSCPKHPSTSTCYVWLGESGIPLNACSTAFRQLPFLSFYNFSGEYFHWYCKGRNAYTDQEEVSIVSALRGGSANVLGFHYLCYFYSRDCSFHFEHPFYHADEYPTSEFTKKIEAYVLQKQNYTRFGMKAIQSRKSCSSISAYLRDVDEMIFRNIIKLVLILNRISPSQTYLDLLCQDQLRDSSFIKFLEAMGLQNHAETTLATEDFDQGLVSRFVVESSSNRVDMPHASGALPLIIFDNTGGVFDLAAFKCPETKIICVIKEEEKCNSSYMYRVFLFLNIKCSSVEKSNELAAQLKDVQFMHLDSHSRVYSKEFIKEVVFSVVRNAVKVVCNQRISIHELFNTLIDSCIQSVKENFIKDKA